MPVRMKSGFCLPEMARRFRSGNAIIICGNLYKSMSDSYPMIEAVISNENRLAFLLN